MTQSTLPFWREPGERAVPAAHDGAGSLVSEGAERVRIRLESIDWDFADSPPSRDRHSVAGYPAKFVPSLPRELIDRLSVPGDLVVDPFCGSGTTLVEAARLGRDGLGLDASPWATLLSRVKLSIISESDDELDHVVDQFEGKEAFVASDTSWAPSIENRPKWYADSVYERLLEIRAVVASMTPGPAERLATLAFAQVASRSSFQESESRYVSKPRPVDPGRLSKDVALEIRRIQTILRSDRLALIGRTDVWDTEATHGLRSTAIQSRVGLIVTSPPYPNAYDYHLYQRFRLLWLGADPTALRRVEIGSHLRGQSEPDAPGKYLREMRSVLDAAFDALIPGRYAVVVVGDGLFRGERFATASSLLDEALQSGFKLVAMPERNLPVQRRTIGVGRRLAREQLLVLRKPLNLERVLVALPTYSLKEYEKTLLQAELAGLGTTGEARFKAQQVVVEIETSDALRLRGLSFGARVAGHRVFHTDQWIVEGRPGPDSRRKNSTYLSHGIHRFKGKFYPQLAKALINASGLRWNDVVVDPFGGSGTTLLESNLAGYDAWSVDCNPLSTAVARVKRLCLDLPPAAISEAADAVLSRCSHPTSREQLVLGYHSSTCRKEVQGWFSPGILRKLDRLYASIHEIGDSRLIEVFIILVSDMLRDVSHQEPKDLRIRRRAKPLVDAPIFGEFADRAYELARRLTNERPDARLGEGHTVTADSASAAAYSEIDAAGKRINAVITSPPYASALPYVDTDRLSLVALFGLDGRSRQSLEDHLIGSRELTKSQVAFEEALLAAESSGVPTSTVDFLERYQSAVRATSSAGFRLRNAPAVLTRYFRSIAQVFGELSHRMPSGGAVHWVVGDSSSSVAGERWVIPTVQETVSIANGAGFRLMNALPISVTRADVLHSRHTITKNQILTLVRRD